jgi:glycosyltransferase involved in cell wall biosynthesis
MNKLISCTLPTRGRQQWAAQAVACFLSQTYEPKELIILDDERERSFPKGSDGFPRSVLYVSHSEDWNIAKKRNQFAKYVSGSILCHFDSDDWSDAGRLEAQVNFMNQTQKAVVGFNQIFFVDEQQHQVWKYRGPFAVGTSLMYTRDYFLVHPFLERKRTGSDSAFIQDAFKTRDTVAVDAKELMVARVHSENTAEKRTYHKNNFRISEWNQLPEKFLQCLHQH